MRKLILVALAFFYAGVFSPLQADQCREIIGYFPSWQMYKRNGCVVPEVVDYSRYSILNYSFFAPDEDGNLQGTDPWADTILLRGRIDWSKPQPAYFPNTSLVDFAHLWGVKMMVSIGGWTLSDNFPSIAADPKKRAHFAHECVRLLRVYQFDGIDIDWEYPGYDEHSGTPDDKKNFTLFMKAIRDSIDVYGKKIEQDFLLTGAFGANLGQMEHIEWDKITKFMDYINMMTYDFNGTWSEEANHNSPLYSPEKGGAGSLDNAYKLMTEEYNVPSNMLNLGVAFYGRTLRGFDGDVALHAKGHKKKVDDVVFPIHEGMPQYFRIENEMKSHGYKEHWDDVSKVPYLISEDEQSFVSYDNEKSIRLKAEYIVDKKCAGAIIWDIFGDYMEKKEGSHLISGTPLCDQLVDVLAPCPQDRIKKDGSNPFLILTNRKVINLMIDKVSLKAGKLLGFAGLIISSSAFAKNNTATTAADTAAVETSGKPFAGTTTMQLNPAYAPEDGKSLGDHFNFLGKGDKKPGLFAEDLNVTGVVRFISIYRAMGDHYVDQINSDRNLSFLDYPVTGVGNNPNGGFPTMEINLTSKLRSNFDFNVGYSFAHGFTGDVTNSFSRQINSRQNLNFTGNLRTGLFKTSVMAGEILWTNLSRFTMGQPEYRDNYFNRLPWDWYRQSHQRYVEYFTLSNNIGAEALGRAPLTGVVFNTEYLPWQTSIKGVFGRTNRSVVLANSTSFFPSYTYALRGEKVVFERWGRGKAGINFYRKVAKTAVEPGAANIDNNTVASLDFNVKVKKVTLSGEFGMGKLVNPGTMTDDFGQMSEANADWAGGFVFRSEFDKRAVLVPFSVEYYNIAEGLGSLDGSIINSNPNLGDGGFTTEGIYDNLFMPNIAQEVGQMANNRQGVNFRAEGGIGTWFKAQLGYAFSAENANKHDTITIQHRVNSFSRSRFRPWFQASGPYHRIKGFWLRTFETLTVTNGVDDLNADGTPNYLKGFNAAELLLKFKFPLGKQQIVILNFTSLNTVGKGFSPFPKTSTSDDVFVTLFYNDFTMAFKATEKLSFVGNFAIEMLDGNKNLDLSPDAEKVNAPDEERVIDQMGTMTALGVDYDISRTMSLHLRHKFMTHEDKNFLKDKFNGQETTFEFKIFF